MKCLISGINGVVGKNLAEVLRTQYCWDVFGIGRRHLDHKNYFQLDLTSDEEVGYFSRIVGGYDLFIHCAAQIDFSKSHSELFRSNLIGTLNAAKIGMSAAIDRFINISSIPVIGHIVNQPISEAHPCNPLTYYHMSKLHAEHALQLWGVLNPQFQTVTLRIPSPVGMGMPPRSIVPILIEKALNNFDIEITGDVRAKQSYLDIRDLAQGVVKAAQVQKIDDMYLIGPRYAINRLDLASTIVDLLNSKSNIIDSTVLSENYYENWSVNSTKANQELGYEPHYSIQETIEWIVRGR